MADLGRDDLIWDIDEVQRRIACFGLLRHYKGDFAGQPFHIEEWQKFIVGSIYGWKWKRTGKRRYRYAYIEVPRKNGKSFLSAGFGVMGLICGGSGLRPEPGAEVYTAATKEDQAKIVWKDAVALVKRSPGFSDVIDTRTKELRHSDSDSFFRPLGADSLTLDGLNPYVVIMDELHAWPSRDLWDVLTDGMGARSEPLVIQITTAGYEQTGICFEQRKHVVALLEGRDGYQDDAYFGIIYTTDAGDDPFEPKTWYKANPNLGISKTLQYMEEEAQRAQLVPSKLNAFLNKQLNIWTEQEEIWLPMEKWDLGSESFKEDDLISSECVGALDLASTGDIAALVWKFRKDGRGFVVPRFFIPKDNIRARVLRDRVPYDLWVKQGLLTATPGDLIDYEYIRARTLEDAEKFKPTEIAFDRWNANDTVTILTNAGLKMTPFGQGYASMSPAMKALETEIVSGKLIHGGNPILRWMMLNVAPTRDAAGNIKPDKSRSREKIDGVVAMIMAHGVMILTAPKQGSVYETRGALQL